VNPPTPSDAAADVPAAGQAPDTLQQALLALFESLSRPDAPGLVVGVAQHGRALLRRGWGLASVALRTPNTPGQRMRIGSTSKHFTCLAALLLAEDGLLEIDAPVGRFLPEWPRTVAQPTLRQLMTHTAGARCHFDLVLLASGMSRRPAGAVMRTLLRQSALNFRPGSEFLYSNGGYELLSEVIERAAGMPFEQVLRTRIFEPLGMHQTVSLPDDDVLLPGLAELHLPQPDGSFRRGFLPMPDFRGDGAMVSTVDDMLTWLAHLRAPGKVGTADTWRQMLQTAQLDDGEPLPYALGLMRHDYRGVEVVHHAGGVVGGSCQMLTVPAHGLDLILMLNGAPHNPMELAWRVVDTVLGSQALRPPRARALAARFPGLPGSRWRDPQTRFVAEFSEQGGHLALKSWNLLPVPMHDDGPALRVGADDMPEDGITIAVADLPAGDAAPAELPVRRGRRLLRLQRLALAGEADDATAGADLVGCYRAEDLAADVRIERHGAALQMLVQADAPVVRGVLQAWAPDVFGLTVPDVPEVPLGGVLSVQREAGRVTGLLLDTFRSRGLWLRRLPGHAGHDGPGGPTRSDPPPRP
jgi:CubicO group peptidase (beta-lactamase class C family)